jgi:hypothetical protein
MRLMKLNNFLPGMNVIAIADGLRIFRGSIDSFQFGG